MRLLLIGLLGTLLFFSCGTEPSAADDGKITAKQPVAAQLTNLDLPTLLKVKAGGTLWLTSNVPISIRKSKRDRVFNMVPGVQAVPFVLDIPPKSKESIFFNISVIESS
jgi:hypothetical protein